MSNPSQFGMTNAKAAYKTTKNIIQVHSQANHSSIDITVMALPGIAEGLWKDYL